MNITSNQENGQSGPTDSYLLGRRTLLRAAGITGLVAAGGLWSPFVPAAEAAVGAMGWPVTGKVTSLIGPRNGRVHEGIDISVAVGNAVYAAAAGKVVAAQSYNGYGNTVILDHGQLSSLPMRWFTLYAHLSGFRVSNGATVARGTHIAASGNTGTSTGPHLHFEALTNTATGADGAINGSPFRPLNSATAVGRSITAKGTIGIDFPGLLAGADQPSPDYFVGMAAPSKDGYWLVGRDGGVFTFGGLEFLGSMGNQSLNSPVVGMAARRAADGYWLVAGDGGVFAHGAAPFKGSMGGKPLNAPVVGMAGHPSGEGYWLVAADGGVFAYNAPFHGSMGGQPLNARMVGMAAHPSGNGYWLVAADGGVFAYNAPFHGSMGGQRLNAPVVGIAAHPGGNGYWLVAADGGVFAFNAPFKGSAGGAPLRKKVVGIAGTPSGDGYWLVAGDGGVFSYGDAQFYGNGLTFDRD